MIGSWKGKHKVPHWIELVLCKLKKIWKSHIGENTHISSVYISGGSHTRCALGIPTFVNGQSAQEYIYHVTEAI